jgi:hypothetical protein
MSCDLLGPVVFVVETLADHKEGNDKFREVENSKIERL